MYQIRKQSRAYQIGQSFTMFDSCPWAPGTIEHSEFESGQALTAELIEKLVAEHKALWDDEYPTKEAREDYANAAKFFDVQYLADVSTPPTNAKNAQLNGLVRQGARYGMLADTPVVSNVKPTWAEDPTATPENIAARVKFDSWLVESGARCDLGRFNCAGDYIFPGRRKDV